MKIIILRHGKPVTPSLSRLSASAFSDGVKEYNAAGLCPTSKPTEHARNCANKCHAIVCSDLRRSIESAKSLKNASIILSDSVFNEVDLPVAHWQTIKLSPSIWLVTFRALWFLGYTRTTESFIDAKSRASEAVKKLTEIAIEHKSVLFVGHGVFNKILANELRLSGWSGPKNPGGKHWSFGVYEQ